MVDGRLIAQRYRLLRRLGEGGMGAVYEAQHELTRRRYAVKVLDRRESLPTEAVERFAREARAPTEIQHPNVVEVFDAGTEPDGTLYLVMELLEGETLGDLFKRERVVQGPLFAAVMDQLLAGLGAMHSRGYVHRDLKPANIFLVRDPASPGGVKVKLLDFGIAKALGEDSRTHSGYVIGTPAYMAPEQMRSAKSATPRSDLWSVGVILFEGLAGYRPFRGETFSLLAQISGPGAVPSLSRVAPHLPEGIVAIVQSLLAKDPSLRPSDANELRQRLSAALNECPTLVPMDPPDSSETSDTSSSNPGLGGPKAHGAPPAEIAPEGRRSGLSPGEQDTPQLTETDEGVSGSTRLLTIAIAAMVMLSAGGLLAMRTSGLGGRGIGAAADAGSTPHPTPNGAGRNNVSSNTELTGLLHRWLGTVAAGQGQSALDAFYASAVSFRGSNGPSSPTEIRRYWQRLFSGGGSFIVDWDRSTFSEVAPDLNQNVAATCINLPGATGRVIEVRGFATEVVTDRSADIGCPRLEGVYLMRLRRTGGALKICHETWSLREGICSSCPTAPVCRRAGITN